MRGIHIRGRPATQKDSAPGGAGRRAGAQDSTCLPDCALPDRGVEKHVTASSSDLLMTPQKSLAFISCAFGRADRSCVPRLDVQLQPVQIRDGPGEGSGCAKGIGCPAVSPGVWRNAISHLGAPCLPLPQPQSYVPHGKIGFNRGYREGKRPPLNMVPPLPLYPFQGVRMSGIRWKASHGRDIRIRG